MDRMNSADAAIAMTRSLNGATMSADQVQALLTAAARLVNEFEKANTDWTGLWQCSEMADELADLFENAGPASEAELADRARHDANEYRAGAR